MNHRERVISAIKHMEVDRPPYDFWAEPATMERLFRFVGHRDLEKLLQDFDVDIRHIEADMPKEKDCGGFYQNFWGERYIYKENEWGYVREDMPGALSKAHCMKDLIDFDWPSPDMFDYKNLVGLCNQHQDYAIMYGFADIWERPALVRGMENALLDLVLNPDWVHFMARKYTDFYKEDYTRAFKASRGKIDIFLLMSDLGSQMGPLISINMFNEFVAPYLKEITDHVHNMGAYIMYHSCGMIQPFIEHLIEIGIDILDPIQPVHEKMKPENLIQKFGNRICFHGGIDIQYLLPFGTPLEVMAEVKHYCDILSKKGGYICAPAHLFQPDIPPENIISFYNPSLLIKYRNT